jgi:hypothetical protein
MKKLYSIAICAPESINEIVREMKLKVAAGIGWYHNGGADANVSIMEFLATDFEIELVIGVLKRFCRAHESAAVYFPEVSSTPSSGAVFLEPSESSSAFIRGLVKEIELPKSVIGRKPAMIHMPIARRLQQDHFRKAVRMLRNARYDIGFQCEGITLRQFDPVKKEFFAKQLFSFARKQDQSGSQLSFF